jgi:hypothetical protein
MLANQKGPQFGFRTGEMILDLNLEEYRKYDAKIVGDF